MTEQRGERPASRLDGWELVELLGQGAMGTVWRARHVASGRPAALKLVRPGPDRGARLAREAALAARLDHPGVVRVLAASAPGAPTPWVAFELLERATPLGQVWAELGRLQRLSLLRDVARAVGHAHARGVVHRDLKPDNILVDAAGLPRVADFGLAIADDVEQLTRTGVLLGTPLYMAPEQASAQRGVVGPPTDVWALGVMLHEALVDRPPFEGHTGFLELVRLITTTRPAGPRAQDPTVSPALDALVLSCLALEPRERPPDGEAVAAALDRLLAGGPAPRPGAGRVARAGARRRRRLLLAALAVAGVLLAAVGVGLAVARRPPPAIANPPPGPALPGLALVPASGCVGHLVPASLDALVAGPEPGWLDGLAFEVAPKGGPGGGHAARRLCVVRTTDHGATWSRLAALEYAAGTSSIGATLLRAPDGRLLVVAGQTVTRPVRAGVEWGEVDVAKGTIGPLRPVFDGPVMTFTPHAALDRAGRLVVVTMRHDGAVVLRRQTEAGWGPTLVVAAGASPVSTHGSTPFGVAVDADDRVRVLYTARRDERRGLFARSADGEQLLPELTVEPEVAPLEFGGGAVLDDAGWHHVAYRLPDGARVVSSISRAGQVERRLLDLGPEGAAGPFALYLDGGGPRALVAGAGGELVRVTLSGLYPWTTAPVSVPGPAPSGGFTLLRRPPPGVALALLRLVRDAAGAQVVLGHELPTAALPAAGAPPAPPAASVRLLGRWPGAVGASPLDPGPRSLVEAGPALLALARVDHGRAAIEVELLRSDDRGESWRRVEAPGGLDLAMYGALLPARDGATVEAWVWGVGADRTPAMVSRTYDVARDAWTGPATPAALRDPPVAANVTQDPRGEPVIVYAAAKGTTRGAYVVRRRDGALGHPARVAEGGTIEGVEVSPDEHLHLLLLTAGAQSGASLRYLRLDAALGTVLDEPVAEGAAIRAALGLDGEGAAALAVVEPARLMLQRWPARPGPPAQVSAGRAFAPRARPRVALAFEAGGPVVYSTDGPRLLRAWPDAGWTRLEVEELEVPGARQPLDSVAALRRPGALVRGLVVVAGDPGAEGGALLLARTVR